RRAPRLARRAPVPGEPPLHARRRSRGHEPRARSAPLRPRALARLGLGRPGHALHRLARARQRAGRTVSSSTTSVAPKPAWVAPPGTIIASPSAAAPVPWRGVAIGGPGRPEAADGSYTSTVAQTPPAPPA